MRLARMIGGGLLLLCSLAVSNNSTVGAEPPSAPAAFEPTSAYEIETIEGWNVYFHKRLLKDAPELAEQVRKEMTRQLAAIVETLPADKVERLQKTKIWVERFHPKFPCACYHPSVDWLRENGFNPEKVDSVDISNPEHFVEWSREQPWMMLHELAHGYHDQVLKHGHSSVRKAYERAKSSGTFEKIRHINGKTVRHYALNNDEEYFAETTEAYFGKNDFYPFNRVELKEFDPDGFALMQEVWEAKED
ncbi:hypothetical protein [Lacipirellula parvula]|uniref:hypothetical protein n=1 Tax=Lacipirellula parvula TaxID=2650471 RepID=UPI001260F5FC|nr:hypothetical protein [Lacipirellula parvula]